MKLRALFPLLFAASLTAQINVQKNASGVVSNGNIVIGNNTTLTATGNGSIIATGGTATSVAWGNVTGTPTTLSGYGVTNTLSTTAPITGGGALSGNLTIAMPAATSGANGYLTSSDWTTFNSKQAALGPTVSFSANVITSNAVRAAGSAGLLLENSSGTTVLTVGPGPGTGATFAGQVNASAFSGNGALLTNVPVAVGNITGLGTGVAAALANTTNASGGLVTFNGTLGAATATSIAGAAAANLTLSAGSGTQNIIMAPTGTGFINVPLATDASRVLFNYDVTPVAPESGNFRTTYEVSNNDVGARPNRIMGFGYNYAPGGSAAMAGEPAMAWIIESFFKPDSSAGYVEGHLQYTTIGSSGLIRPLSTKILRDTTVAGSTTTTTVMGDSVSIVDTSAVPRITVSSGGMFLGNSTSIYQSTNNVAAIFGRKTDSVDVELLKVNASNNVQIAAGAISVNPSTNAATFAGAISGTSATLSSLTSGRVPIVSTSGLLADDADLTFSTDTLTATKGTFGNITHVAGAISTTTGNLTIGTASGSGGALTLSPDGGGGVTVASAAGTQLTVREASNGTGKIRITNGASGVNYLEISNDSSPKFTTNDGQIYFLKTIAAQGTVNLRDFTDISNLQGFIEGVELAGSPAAPASNKFRIYAKDNGAGKTVLYVRFASGAEQQIAIEP